jgi:hypothetical protein
LNIFEFEKILAYLFGQSDQYKLVYVEETMQFQGHNQNIHITLKVGSYNHFGILKDQA